MFAAALCPITKMRKQAKSPSIDDWVEAGYVHSGYYLARKRRKSYHV